MTAIGRFFSLVLTDLGGFIIKDLRRFLYLETEGLSVLWMLWTVLFIVAGAFYVPFAAMRDAGRYINRKWAMARETVGGAE